MLALLVACGTGDDQQTVPPPPPGPTPAGWHVVVPPTGLSAPLAMSISPEGDIYIGSGNANVFSHDHGATWNVSAVADPPAQISAITALGPDEIYAGGVLREAIVTDSVPFVAKSTDGGTTWSQVPMPSDLSGRLMGLGRDARGLFVIGYGGYGGFFARTADGGATWTRALFGDVRVFDGSWLAPNGDIYAVAERVPTLDAPDAYVVFRSSDGGVFWAVVAHTSESSFEAISGSPDGTRILAVGYGPIAESRDGGATWRAGNVFRSPVLEDLLRVTDLYLPDAVTDPYVAAREYGVLRVSEVSPTGPSADYNYTVEQVPSNPVESVASNPLVMVVRGSSSGEIWAAGYGPVLLEKRAAFVPGGP